MRPEAGGATHRERASRSGLHLDIVSGFRSTSSGSSVALIENTLPRGSEPSLDDWALSKKQVYERKTPPKIGKTYEEGRSITASPEIDRRRMGSVVPMLLPSLATADSRTELIEGRGVSRGACFRGDGDLKRGKVLAEREM